MAESTGKKQRGPGRPFKPGESGNPKGRPPGAQNKATRLAQSLLDGEAEILVRKLIELAKAGDLQALKICVDRLIPPIKSQVAPIQIDLPTTANLVETAGLFLGAAADGRLSPDTAAQLISAVGTLARVAETEDLKKRLAALESAVKNAKQ